MQPVLITKSEFAKLAKVSAAAITKACKADLAPALSGKKINLRRPECWEYLHRRGVAVPYESGGPPPGWVPGSKLAAPDPAPVELPDFAAPELVDPELGSVADMTLREIVNRWGTRAGFKDWVDVKNKLEQAEERELKNRKSKGLLIEREFVKLHIFGAIDAAHRQLLHDAPKTLVRRLFAAARSGQSIEEGEAIALEIVESHLKNMKATAVRLLKPDEH